MRSFFDAPLCSLNPNACTLLGNSRIFTQENINVAFLKTRRENRLRQENSFENFLNALRQAKRSDVDQAVKTDKKFLAKPFSKQDEINRIDQEINKTLRFDKQGNPVNQEVFNRLQSKKNQITEMSDNDFTQLFTPSVELFQTSSINKQESPFEETDRTAPIRQTVTNNLSSRMQNF